MATSPGDTFTKQEVLPVSLGPRIVHLQPCFDLHVSFNLIQAFYVIGTDSLNSRPTYLISFNPPILDDNPYQQMHTIRSLLSFHSATVGCGRPSKKITSVVVPPSQWDDHEFSVVHGKNKDDPYQLTTSLLRDSFYYVITDPSIHSAARLWVSSGFQVHIRPLPHVK